MSALNEFQMQEEYRLGPLKKYVIYILLFVIQSAFGSAHAAELNNAAVQSTDTSPTSPQYVPVVHGEYSILGARHWVGGSGDKSLLRPGAFLSNELRLRFEDPLPDNWNFTADLHARQTPDPQIDKHKDVRLLGWTAELYNTTVHFTGGDFFGDMTQYTMQQAVTGAQAVYKTDTLELKGLGGYSQRDDDGKSFLRYVYGGRSEAKLIKESGVFKDWVLGVNFSGSEDDHSTIDTTGGVADASNRVGSVNSRVALWGNTDLDAELAKSWLDPDTSIGSNVDRKTGTALRLNSDTRFSKKARARLGYEWVSADFGTLSGSAVPDRVNMTSRFDYKFNREWNSEAGYRVFFDKLDKSTLNKRTITMSPRAAVNWQPQSDDWLLKDYYSRLYWEARRRTSDDDPSGQTDFLSNETGIENEFRVEKVNFNTGWSIRSEDDDHIKENTILTNTGYFGMRIRERILNADFVPSLRYQFDYDYLPKLEGRDLSQSVIAGLNIDLQNGLRLEQRYSIETGSRLAPDADTIRFNVYLGMDYKIPVKEDLTLKLNYQMVDLRHDLDTERFSENNLQAQLLWKF